MTREEAKTALGDRNNLLWGMSNEEKKYYSEALDMAISALSAEGEYIKKSEVFEIWHTKYCDTREENDETQYKMIDNLPTYSFPDREKHYCKNCMFFNSVDIRDGVYVCGLKGGTVYGCDCCEEWKGSAVPKRETTDRIEYGTDGQPYKYSISNDVPEREKGEWKMDDGTNAVCPICNKINGARGDFCKWCGADMRGKSCNTCKNNDDEFSGECYECLKGIFDHYEPESGD